MLVIVAVVVASDPPPPGRPRPRAAFLCLLAYYLEWHLRQAWAELLFVDEEPPRAADPVAGAERSQAAKRKASTQKTGRGETCHSFRSLLAELALVIRNTNRVRGQQATFDTVTDPNPTQARALELLEHIPKHA
jgi:hypothetical protein